jgi:amyloid beta (A4) precursor protein-binding family A protein 1 (X11)
VGLQVDHSRNFTLSPETTDCDSNDIESEVSLENEGSMHSSGGGRLYGSMPVLEDGLSSGHASDAEDSPTLASTLVPMPDANPTVLLMKKQICEIEREIRSRAHKHDAVTAKLTNITAASTIPVQPALNFRAVENFLRGHDVSFSSAAADLDSLGKLN